MCRTIHVVNFVDLLSTSMRIPQAFCSLVKASVSVLPPLTLLSIKAWNKLGTSDCSCLSDVTRSRGMVSRQDTVLMPVSRRTRFFQPQAGHPLRVPKISHLDGGSRLQACQPQLSGKCRIYEAPGQLPPRRRWRASRPPRHASVPEPPPIPHHPSVRPAPVPAKSGDVS